MKQSYIKIFILHLANSAKSRAYENYICIISKLPVISVYFLIRNFHAHLTKPNPLSQNYEDQFQIQSFHGFSA